MRQVTHALLTRPPLSHFALPPERFKAMCFARLACVRHAASVHPEPGSNSRMQNLGFVFKSLMFVCAPHALSEVPHELSAVGASSFSWKTFVQFRINLQLILILLLFLVRLYSIQTVRKFLSQNFQGLLSIVQFSRCFSFSLSSDNFFILPKPLSLVKNFFFFLLLLFATPHGSAQIYQHFLYCLVKIFHKLFLQYLHLLLTFPIHCPVFYKLYIFQKTEQTEKEGFEPSRRY